VTHTHTQQCANTQVYMLVRAVTQFSCYLCVCVYVCGVHMCNLVARNLKQLDAIMLSNRECGASKSPIETP